MVLFFFFFQLTVSGQEKSVLVSEQLLELLQLDFFDTAFGGGQGRERNSTLMKEINGRNHIVRH